MGIDEAGRGRVHPIEGHVVGDKHQIGLGRRVPVALHQHPQLRQIVGKILAGFAAPVSGVAPVTTGLPAAPVGYEYRTFSLAGSNNLAGTGFLRVRVSP